MTQASFQINAPTPQNLQLMKAYAVRAAAQKSSNDEFDGWMERIDCLKDLTSQDLTTIHGQLIALGYLKFEISGRAVGLRYQLSSRGRQTLESAVTGESQDADAHSEAA